MPWKQIVAQAVHDLRTPLSSLRVTLEVLRMTPSDPEAHAKLIGMMGRQVDLIADLLETLSKDPGTLVARSGKGPETD